MKEPATIKMLQELGAFILAGAKGPRDVKTMLEMIRVARGYCLVGYLQSSGKIKRKGSFTYRRTCSKDN